MFWNWHQNQFIQIATHLCMIDGGVVHWMKSFCATTIGIFFFLFDCRFDDPPPKKKNNNNKENWFYAHLASLDVLHVIEELKVLGCWKALHLSMSLLGDTISQSELWKMRQLMCLLSLSTDFFIVWLEQVRFTMANACCTILWAYMILFFHPTPIIKGHFIHGLRTSPIHALNLAPLYGFFPGPTLSDVKWWGPILGPDDLEGEVSWNLLWSKHGVFDN